MSPPEVGLNATALERVEVFSRWAEATLQSEKPVREGLKKFDAVEMATQFRPVFESLDINKQVCQSSQVYVATEMSTEIQKCDIVPSFWTTTAAASALKFEAVILAPDTDFRNTFTKLWDTSHVGQNATFTGR